MTEKFLKSLMILGIQKIYASVLLISFKKFNSGQDAHDKNYPGKLFSRLGRKATLHYFNQTATIPGV
jgi:hypothetical protein